MPSGETLDVLLVKSRTPPSCPVAPLLLTTVLVVIAIIMRKEKRSKNYLNWKIEGEIIIF